MFTNSRSRLVGNRPICRIANSNNYIRLGLLKENMITTEKIEKLKKLLFFHGGFGLKQETPSGYLFVRVQCITETKEKIFFSGDSYLHPENYNSVIEPIEIALEKNDWEISDEILFDKFRSSSIRNCSSLSRYEEHCPKQYTILPGFEPFLTAKNLDEKVMDTLNARIDALEKSFKFHFFVIIMTLFVISFSLLILARVIL